MQARSIPLVATGHRYRHHRSGITAAASTPEVRLDDAVERLKAWGREVKKMEREDETVSFRLPVSLLRTTALRETRKMTDEEHQPP